MNGSNCSVLIVRLKSFHFTGRRKAVQDWRDWNGEMRRRRVDPIVTFASFDLPERGGHFAAFEQSALFATDIRRGSRAVRGKATTQTKENN
ncbi:hypothetical protein AYJ54_40015 [Bradyrhizobium centrolobii]|uniref:Uncharacterized protein n=1 Tax=Bradyrhizobium centrolobii TaxID=1505087 RepID=A0A176Z4B1_9BRAD|nr:hypothetical protein AYJ54_40015 [Bradyrhizobium centrolobii]